MKNSHSQKILVNLFRLYKGSVSPYINKGMRCKFYPTCSEYAVLAIQKYGIFWGIIKTFGRILRCNPFSQGGVDLP